MPDKRGTEEVESAKGTLPVSRQYTRWDSTRNILERNSRVSLSLTGTHMGTLGFGSRSLDHYSPECDDLLIASNAASASSGRARTTKSSVRFTQRTFPDESIRNSAGREMSAPSRRPCTCTRSHLRITSSCASERIGNV